MAQCRSCGAEIRWCKTSTGKSMPVDEVASVDGNIACLPDGSCMILSETQQMSWEGMRHKSHFATCANAAQHRKPK